MGCAVMNLRYDADIGIAGVLVQHFYLKGENYKNKRERNSGGINRRN